MSKLARLAKKIHFNGPLREALKSACETKGCPVKIIRRPVRTRWNSTTVMLGDALEIKPALHAVSKAPSNKLGKWALDNDEWKVLQDLHTVLEVGDRLLYDLIADPFIQSFRRTTLRMEGIGRLLVHMVIPLIDNLTATLDRAAVNEEYHIAVRAGALAGVEVLNKYYSQTDKSIVYRLAMCIDDCISS